MASVRWAVDTVAPRFTALTPADGAVVAQPSVTVRGSVDDPDAAVVLQGVGTATTTSTTSTEKSFSIPVTLAAGPNSLQLSAIDRAGNSASAALRLTYAASSVRLSVTSPADGATVRDRVVTLEGTFEGTGATGITVNGVVAGKSGNRFVASVPLEPGANTLTVVATAPDGAATQKSITVTSVAEADLQLSAERSRGVAPFSTTLTLTNNTAKQVVRIDVDTNGDGVVDTSTTDIGAAIPIAFPQAGLFQPRVTVYFDDQTQATASVPIAVLDPQVLDAELRAIWSRFTTSLAAGNQDAAMAEFNRSARFAYGQMLVALAPRLPAIAASFSPLSSVSLSGEIGEYALVRASAGRNKVYLVYFLLGNDGVWRLDSM